MEITRPLRQVLYGLLFSYSDQIQQNHRRKRHQHPILVREWHPCRLKPDRVQATGIDNETFLELYFEFKFTRIA